MGGNKASIKPKHLIQSALWIALALAVFLASLQLPFPKSAADPSPAILPIGTAIILVVLAVLLLVFPTETERMPGRSELLRVARTLVIFAAYVALIPILQFIVATWIYLIVILLVSGERRVLTVGVLPPIASVVLFVLFYSLLGVSIPAGGLELFIHKLLF